MLEQLKRLFTRQDTRQQPAVPAPTGDTIVYNAYCTRLLILQPTFPHTLQKRRDLSDPALLEHLNSFCGYVFGRGDGQMSRDKYHVILHLQRVQHYLSIAVGADDTASLFAWAKEANAVLFSPDGHVCDPEGRILVNAVDGKADPEARVPYPEQAWARKAQSEAALKERGIEVAGDLPPLVCEDELALRDRDQAVGRARALLLVALRAESVASNEPMSVDTLTSKMPLADDHLSPKEKAFLALASPSQEECAQLIWRYESLYVLEWALGLLDELPFPAAACDTATTVARLIEMRGPELRAPSEILDALDLTYRLHWCVRQQRLKKLGEVAGVDADVVMERHHTLNWLVQFQYSDWDHVDTPT